MMAKIPSKTWVEAIEQVLKDEGKPLHVRDIAKLAIERGYKPPHNTAHQTVSEKCQRNPILFRKTEPNTYRLSKIRFNEQTIHSMITVKAGTLMSGLLRKAAIDRVGGHCQYPGCKVTKTLQVHHVNEKADLFRYIAAKHNLSFTAKDSIQNIMDGLKILMEHPRFCDPSHVEVYCARHHKQLTKERSRQKRMVKSSK